MEEGKTNTRVILAKLGMDIHTRAPLVIAKALREAGMEVIYLGPCVTPEMVVNTAIQEDADVIALSSHSGFHRTLFPKLMNLLKEKDREDICVVAGGIIPARDKPWLESIGITGNFGPGTPPRVAAEHVAARVRSKQTGSVGRGKP